MSSANAVSQLATAGNVLSLIGCGIIVSWYYFTHRTSSTQTAGSGHVVVHHKALLHMAITNIFLNVGGLIYSGIGYADNRSICVLQGLHITYFNLSNWLWTLCISYNILFILKRISVYPDHLGKVFCVICWALPGVIIVPLLVTRDTNIVNIGPWCWIPGNRNDLRYGTFYGWLIATYFANVAILAIIVYTAYHKRATMIGNSEERLSSGNGTSAQKAVNSASTNINGVKGSATLAVPTSGSAQALRSPSPQRPNTLRRPDPYAGLVRRYVSYVFVILFCWIFGIALRFGQVSNPNFNDLNLTALHTFFSISQMFWLSIVLVLSSQIQRISEFIFGKGLDSFELGRRRSSTVPLTDRRLSTDPLGERRPSTDPNESRRPSINPEGDYEAKKANSTSAPTKIVIKKMISTKEFTGIPSADNRV
jgi:uncharacterized membrane protein